MGSQQSPTGDRYLGYSPSARHDRSQHYIHHINDMAASSFESPQDSSLPSNARHFRGYSAPEQERYRYDNDGRLLEQNQKSSPTASPTSSPTQQQQQQQRQQQPHLYQQQQHQHQFHPYHHQQHQPHNTMHHYPPYSHPSMHEGVHNNQRSHPMGSHLPRTVGFSIDQPKKEDNRRSPVAQGSTTATTTTTTTTVSNNGRPMSMHALSSSSSPAAHAYERELRASSEVYNNTTHSDPRYHYPTHSHTYPPASDNRSISSNSALVHLSPSPSSPSSSSLSLSVSSSSSTPPSSSSSPTSATARLALNHHPTADSVSAPTTSTSTAGALSLSTATVPWNRSSLRHEIVSMESPPQPASSASFISQHSRHSNPSHGHSHSSSSTPSPPHSSFSSSSSSTSPKLQQQREGQPIIPTTTITAGATSPPASTAPLPSQYPSDKVGAGRPTPTPTLTTVSDPFETDTRSTFVSDSGQQERRGSSISTTTIQTTTTTTATTTMTEEDQEVPRAAAGASARRGEQSSIMRSKRATHHASQAAAAGAAGGDDYYDKEEQDNEENQQDDDDDQEGQGRDDWAGRGLPPPGSSSSAFPSFPSHTTTSSSHGRINNNSYYNNNNNNSAIQQQQQQLQQQQLRFRSDQSFHDSSPPLSPPSMQELRPHSLAQQQQHSIDPSSSSLEHHQKRMMGRPSLSSSSSTSPPPPFAHPSAAAVTFDHPPSSTSSSSQPSTTTGPAHGRFSPSMNHTPLSFDQTGHAPSYLPMHSPGGPSLNNKRRSLADLLFVPTKTKAKRNSSSSSASSVDSYRQDDNNIIGPPDQLSITNWSNHPKSASATSTTSTSSMGSMTGPAGTTTSIANVHIQQQQQQQQQHHRMSLESQASPPARKSSTVKGIGKGAGAGGGGLGSSSSPKTFQCTGYPGCNMVFTRSEHLARHERKHTGEKPYKCIVANCPRTFSRYDNMIQHTQTHSDRTKRDSLGAVAAAATAAAAGGGGGGGAIGSGPHSRSSSTQSTPLLPGRPRGGSSPVVFGPSWDDHHHRRTTQNNSPASPYNVSPAFAHQHHQQQQQQQSHHPAHHPIHWSLPSGAPAGSSPAMPAQYYSHHHGAESHPYLPGHQGPSTPVVRTLKANSRSLPHLQARASPMALSSSSSTAESPSVGLQQGMSTMEIEELKRRKSEVLLPSSFSGAGRAATMSTATGVGQGIGLGMSPFTPTTSHPQSLPQVEKLTAGEQERLNEHRRSAQAMFFKMNAGREGSMDARRTPEYSDSRPCSQQQHQQPPQQQQQQQQPLGTSSSTPRSGSAGPVLPHVQQLSAQEKDRLLEHRKSTPELLHDVRIKRSSNDPADMVVQPLPSRDSRSGMQWFSQVSTPLTSSPRSSLTPREGGGGSFSVQGHGTSSSSAGHTSGESPMILPPIMGPYEELRQGRLRSHSSHIHPLSRPTTQFDPSSLAQFSSSEESKDQQRQQFDAATALSPRLERHWEEQYLPIRKRHVVEAIERMDSREFAGLKYQVAEHHANEQFRNPEFLGNMTAILCVIRAPHTAWKGGERRQGSQGSVASASEHGGSSFAGSRRTSRDMEVDESERASFATATKATTATTVIKTEEGVSNEAESMDVDNAVRRISSKDVVVQPCRFALDIDVDSFSRDPEPDLRGFESLTINSLFPTKSFVTGFEDTTTGENASEKKDRFISSQGYPSNARLGRFYLPERSYRTPESLATQPDPRGRWVCCRFEEYHGVSIWVLESVLDKYHEISRRHKMALTLVGATVHHREAVYCREDWEIHSGEQYEVKARESALYPEMIHQVWRDMYLQHHQRAQQQHQQQQHQQQQLPSMPQVATYEEYQRSLMQSDPRRDSYQQPSHQAPPSRDRASVPYYSYNDYRQQQQSMHREELSSAPSSPQSPRHDDFQDETPHHRHQQQQQQQQQRQGSTANMHRRISIAELCNPMQSLATERAQRREETASKRTSM